ncbi:SOS cell division inhibitor SulA [Halopseudomonas xinjiangensis]|uniref:SOS cell division inhibitor SulA n=1 Tax=Halopseudomonas xinjiangensis TaxID=487184 RepID=A0A1H1RR24_9GAMM|nr:SulA-like leucine-rich domain-containing protein [Halopseudomonas xinjiangensis]SDS38123.1 SOS cell division inhibitor SulA [Halopseudomonas xinjiangensis]
MQYARNSQALDQLSLFQNAWMASRARMAPLGKPAATERRRGAAVERNVTSQPAETGFSEIALNGSPRQCLQWLAPVLRELSHSSSTGWLTLLDPPAELSLQWLRSAGLDSGRILVIRSRPGMDTLELCCEVLREGKSHTVVSWLTSDARETALLSRAASMGNCSSLNVQLQATRAA